MPKKMVTDDRRFKEINREIDAKNAKERGWRDFNREVDEETARNAARGARRRER